jgi:hypothetical protein
VTASQLSLFDARPALAPMPAALPGLDLVARRVIMSAFLYYGINAPVASDAEFDAWCARLVTEWDRLDPLRRWQLEPRVDLAATGMHVKITVAAAHAACAWHEAVRGHWPDTSRFPGEPGICPPGTTLWRYESAHRVHWIPASGVWGRR